MHRDADFARPPETDARKNFAEAVKAFVTCHNDIRALSREMKELRARHASIKEVIISFMQEAELEVCKVTHEDKTGELAIRSVTQKRGLKKEDAITGIAKYMSTELQVGDDADGKARMIWEAMQGTRESALITGLAVRKLT